MNDTQLRGSASRTTSYILRLMLKAMNVPVGRRVTGGLPAGSMRLASANLVIGGTPCTVPLFRAAMERMARTTKSDVLVARHGLHPEHLDPVLFDAVVWNGEATVMLQDLILYYNPGDGYWLVPSAMGAYVRLAETGLHLEAEPPFLTWHHRSDGVTAAARQIIEEVRPAGRR